MAFQQAAPIPGTIIRYGLADCDRAGAAALYWQAFGGKLGRVMGPERKALDFIERVMSSEHAFVAADRAGRIVGVIGFRTSRGSFVGGTPADFDAVYGAVGGAWRSRVLSMLAQDLPQGSLAIDGLAVARDMRGTGIGRALLSRLAHEGRARGYARLRLEVIGDNLRARSLYERLGFEITGRADSRLTNLVFGFRTSYGMELAL